MGEVLRKQAQRPRELRRRVVLPARLLSGAHWSDTCILNISSRGLMIHSARPASEGTIVELRRGEHAIVARVMWRDGTRLGLQSDERLPVEEILSLSQAQALRLVADEGVLIERRKRSRLADHSRLQGRAMQFAGLAVIGVSLAVSIWAMAERAFAQPLAVVTVALAGQP